MGQSRPFRASTLVVEDDPMQRGMICLPLQESEMDVIECESRETAELVLEQADAAYDGGHARVGGGAARQCAGTRNDGEREGTLPQNQKGGPGGPPLLEIDIA
jgi:hypothetical protein